MTSAKDWEKVSDKFDSGNGRDERHYLKGIINTKWLKVTINYVADKSAVISLRDRFANLATAMNTSEANIWLLSAFRGLPLLEAEHADKLDRKAKRLIAISKERERLAYENTTLDDLIPIYHARGEEGFLEWLEDELGYSQQEIDDFWEAYNRRLDSMPWSRKARAWLERELSDSERALPVVEIKRMAVEDGILNDDLSNFRAFEKIAQRMQVTGKPSYGMWFLEKRV